MVEKTPSQFSFLTKILNGGLAGIVGMTCAFPIDLVKTRLQNQPIGPHGEKMYSSVTDAFVKTYKAEGFIGMYRGLAVAVSLIIPQMATVLTANDYFRYKLQTKERKLPVHRQMLAGGLAGLCGTIFNTPVELLKIRMQDAGRAALQDKKAVQNLSARVMAIQVIRENGIFGLYRGLKATMLRDFSFSMMFYPLYATFSALGPKRSAESDEPVFWWSLLVGLTSGSIAAVVVTPFDVVKTRIQALRKSNNEILFSGIAHALLDILRLEGPTALYKGGVCRMLFLAPIFGVTQAVYYIGIAEYLFSFIK